MARIGPNECSTAAPATFGNNWLRGCTETIAPPTLSPSVTWTSPLPLDPSGLQRTNAPRRATGRYRTHPNRLVRNRQRRCRPTASSHCTTALANVLASHMLRVGGVRPRRSPLYRGHPRLHSLAMECSIGCLFFSCVFRAPRSITCASHGTHRAHRPIRRSGADSDVNLPLIIPIFPCI